MNENLDDWLNSLGIEPTDTPATLLESPVSSVEIVSQSQEEPQPQSLSNQDFDDILGDFGFTQPEDTEAEEIYDDQEDEYDENMGEGHDLNAEEDADFQALVDSGGVVPVGGGIMDQISETHTLDVSDIREAIRQTVSTSELEYHEGIGVVEPITDTIVMTQEEVDRISEEMPLSQEETTPEPQEPSANQEEPLLPLNSPTLLLDESTTRFSGAEWYEEIQRQSIIVAGVGGIGSNLVFQLARMHPAALFMYDDDNVEVVNMAGQLYSRNDVGKSKVAAMTDMITAYTNMQNIYALKQRFESNTEAGNIMMCGFDNMEARKTFFLRWQNHVGSLSEEDRKKCLFLDGRLSIDTLQILCLTGDDTANIERYSSSYLFDDSEAEHTVCSMKQTTYLACMIGSLMVNLFTNFVANQLDPIIPYDLPFFTEYDAQNMIFKTIK